MNTAARIPAPKDLGETTIRMVVEFLPDGCLPGEDGTQLITPEALSLAYAIKGLRSQHAGERTIRRVLHSPDPDPAPRGEIRPADATGKIIPFNSRRQGPPPPVRNDFARLASALDQLTQQQSEMQSAMADLDASLDKLDQRLQEGASAEPYDAFLGSLASVQALSRRRPFPLGPGDLA